MSWVKDQIAHDIVVVTPDDNTEINLVGLIYSGGAVKVKTDKGSDTTLPSAFAGILLPGGLVKVYSTGTTATSILGFKV